MLLSLILDIICYVLLPKRRSQVKNINQEKLTYMYYSKHPHIRTHDFGGQADRVLI